MDRQPGLVEVLAGERKVEDAIKATEVENLDLIPYGILPPNPSEMLASGRMGELLDRFKEDYDIVFFDSPLPSP